MIKHKPQQKAASSSDSGFTMIESLLGVVVVAILLASISPVLIMSTAIRVQSRRIEKATQAANTFVDGVRTGSIPAPPIIDLDPVTAQEPRTLAHNLITQGRMRVPETEGDNDLYLFQKDGNICQDIGTGLCTRSPDSPFEEFYIQARRIALRDSEPNDNEGYRLALRVYRGDVDWNDNLLASSEETTRQTSSTVTGGLGNKQAPAVERTVDISNINTSFDALCQRYGTANNAGCN